MAASTSSTARGACSSGFTFRRGGCWRGSSTWSKAPRSSAARLSFEEVGGYDETAWIGEDVDFFWSMKRFAKRTGRTVCFIRNPRVQPSSRRFDTWPLWKVLVWTNPLFIALFRRRKGMWGGWYARPVR